MKKTITMLLFALLPFISNAQAQWNQRYQNYIDQYKDIAIQEMLKYNIPASITLAQGLLESGAGTSELTRKGNNHFGIKCHGWAGRTTYHDDDAKNECFRAYDCALDSYEDHSKFLSSSQRYSSLFKLNHTDYKGWAHGLKAAGYATNPQYANSLINIIETYNLSQYDQAKSYKNFSGMGVAAGEHEIHICNRNLYVIAREGDTFKTIGKELGMNSWNLASYNERGKKDVLSKGDIVWLKKKRTKADKSFKNVPHIVKPGESMYSIAQRYGIRLKSLYKKNHLKPDYEIQSGDMLIVY